MISMLAWGLGYFGMPQVLVRFLSIRSSEEIKKSRIIATTWCCGVAGVRRVQSVWLAVR